MLGVVATVVVLAIGLVGVVALEGEEIHKTVVRQQDALDPFYALPDGWQHVPVGAVVRSETVSGVPAGGRGWRILYRTERADGSPAMSSGLVFAPSGPAPVGGRPVVAWAHGTVGMADQCAPSRTPVVEKGIPGLANFLQAGWVVAATDYSGLGTEGVEQYLVGQSEARDVLNSVRAARNMPIGAGTRVALWGHSQGGQSALWSEALAAQLAPELTIVGTAVAAPATELPTLVGREWQQVGGSLIGAEVLVGWPDAYPGLDVNAVWKSSGGDYKTMADRCIEEDLIDVEIRNLLGQAPLFSKNPMTVPSWRDVAVANVPPAPTAVPTLLVQGLADPLVLPGSNVAYVEAACAAGSTITANFVGDLGHQTAGIAAAPMAFTFFQERFDGKPATTTCGTDYPVPALEP